MDHSIHKPAMPIHPNLSIVARLQTRTSRRPLILASNQHCTLPPEALSSSHPPTSILFFVESMPSFPFSHDPPTLLRRPIPRLLRCHVFPTPNGEDACIKIGKVPTQTLSLTHLSLSTTSLRSVVNVSSRRPVPVWRSADLDDYYGTLKW